MINWHLLNIVIVKLKNSNNYLSILLKSVPQVLSWSTCLGFYVFLYLAVCCVLHAPVFHVPCVLRVLVPHASCSLCFRVSRALCLTCCHTSHGSCFSCCRVTSLRTLALLAPHLIEVSHAQHTLMLLLQILFFVPLVFLFFSYLSFFLVWIRGNHCNV